MLHFSERTSVRPLRFAPTHTAWSGRPNSSSTAPILFLLLAQPGTITVGVIGPPKKSHHSWKRLSGKLFVPPSGNAANDLVTEMTRLILGFDEKTGLEHAALTAFFILPHFLPTSRHAAAKSKAMVRRLEMWRAGDFEGLLAEGRAIRERLRADQHQVSWQRGFVRFMLWGRSSAAMRLLRNGSSKGVLSLDEILREGPWVIYCERSIRIQQSSSI